VELNFFIYIIGLVFHLLLLDDNNHCSERTSNVMGFSGICWRCTAIDLVDHGECLGSR
jgi:hypothetical protein